MPRAYPISRAAAAYCVGFSLVWFGGIVGFVIIGNLAHDWTPARVVAVVAALVIALLPAFMTASSPYRITLTQDGHCEFRSLLRQRRVRVQQITAIDWGEDEISIVHQRGKVRILADRAFKDLLIRLLELNPAIEADDEVRRTLSSAETDSLRARSAMDDLGSNQPGGLRMRTARRALHFRPGPAPLR